MDLILLLLFLLLGLFFIYFLIFFILTPNRNRDKRDDDDPIGENGEVDDNNVNECPNRQFADINNNSEGSTIDDVSVGEISDAEDENENVHQNGPVPTLNDKASEYIDENNESLNECPNSPVSVSNNSPEALPVGKVQFPVVSEVNDKNEVIEKPTFVLGNDPEAPVINDGNERSNDTEIQLTENDPGESAANESPAVGNVENGLIDRDVEFDFSVLDGDLRTRPPQYVEFSISNSRLQDALLVDVANFFPGYWKITGGKSTIDVDGNGLMAIKIEEEKSKRQEQIEVLSVRKYDPNLKYWFEDRESGPTKNKVIFAVLFIEFPANAMSTLINYKKENNEFGLMELKFRVGSEVETGYIRFDWDPTREVIVPSFYNHHIQMGDLKIMKNKDNRLERCRGKTCDGTCEKPHCSRFITEAYFNKTSWLALIFLPMSGHLLCNVTVEKNFMKAGLRFLFPGWRTLKTLPHKHAFKLSQTEKDAFGINFGNPRTRRKLMKWLGNGNVLKVRINVKMRKTGIIKHAIQFELRQDGDRLVPTIRDVAPQERLKDFSIHSSSRNPARNRSFSTFSMHSLNSNSNSTHSSGRLGVFAHSRLCVFKGNLSVLS